nr:molecular chaperone HtpG [Oceanococcus sp. HetDA_MAG_MS8]
MTRPMAEKHVFQAEVQQLLHLMIHSLYSNKEIFLRELISNASDAADKLRFEAQTTPDLMAGDAELKVEIEADKDAGTLTIRDNGIGMSHDELMENLGTIARSGTKKYLEALSGDQAKDSNLIGQFGVGFYSAFIVADKVTVHSRKAGADESWTWVSEGTGEYTLEPSDFNQRGTQITLHLRGDDAEFLDFHRLSHIIKTYSDHISLPVRLRKDTTEDGEDEGFEVVNKGTALWARSKSEIKDEDYQELFRTLAWDSGEALAWVHNKVEGKLEYTSLLFIPSKAPFDLYERDSRRGLKLYVRRVFIMDDAEKLLPNYLRFVRGVIDSNDLPLNVSRELLQSNRVIEQIKSAAVKRVLSLIETMAEKEPEKFQTVLKEFGAVLKEGVVEDPANKEQILKILRFATTKQHADDVPQVSLADYVKNMPSGQDAIYYLTAESRKAALSSPHLEMFKSKDVEVLLLTDRVDEWMINSVPEFMEKPLKSVARGDIKLDSIITDAKAEAEKERVASSFKETCERLQEALGAKVKEVKVSDRLTESAACLVAPEHAMSRHLERLLAQAGETVPGSEPILEVNPQHRLLERLKETSDSDQFADLALLVYEQAVLAEGGQLEEPAAFVARVNRLAFA